MEQTARHRRVFLQLDRPMRPGFEKDAATAHESATTEARAPSRRFT
jgi:hypothetical protein